MHKDVITDKNNIKGEDGKAKERTVCMPFKLS